MGVIKLRVDEDDPRFGKMFPCPSCGPARRQKRYQRKMAKVSEYAVTLTPCRTFEAYKVRDESTEIALEYAQSFVADPRDWLLLWGGVGTGKTHLMMAIARALQAKPIQDRPVVLLATVPGLLDMLRSGYGNGNYEELNRLCHDVDVLMLDDLGTERASQWALERLFEIINHRYNAQMPTCFTTNVNPGDLEPRIASRIQDRYLCKQVHLVSSDYRLEERGR
jgi:DNA replication protein DnaC